MATTREEVVVKMGLDNSDLVKGAEQSSEFMGKLGDKMARKLDKVFFSILGVGFIGQLKEFIKGAIDVSSKAIAELIFKNDILKMQGSVLEDKRLRLREMQKVREEELRAEAKAAAEEQKKEDERREKALQTIGKVDKEMADSKLSLYDKIRDTQEKISYLQRAIAHGDEQSLDTIEDTARLKEYQLKLAGLQEQANKKDLDYQERLNDYIAKRNAPKRELAEKLLTERFPGQLGQLAALEADRAEALRFGNRGRALGDARLIDSLRTSMIQSIRPELNPPVNPQQSVVKSILDELAPLGLKTGINVNVTNVD